MKIQNMRKKQNGALKMKRREKRGLGKDLEKRSRIPLTLGAAILGAAIFLTACMPATTPTANTYTCNNGTAVSGTPPTPGAASCQSCNGGYRMVNNLCVATRYTCPANGIARSGSPDGNVDAEECASCDSGYLSPVGGLCNTPTRYICTNGTLQSGLSGNPVGNENVERCASCNSGLYLLRAEQRCVTELLSNVQNVPDDGNLRIRGAYSVATATIGTTTYLYVTGYYENGVSVFSIADSGMLTPKQNFFHATNLNHPTSATIATIGSNSYLYVAALGRDTDNDGFVDTNSGVSVFSIGADGMLTFVQHISDDADRKLLGAHSVTTFTIGGTTYLYVAGATDNGLSVFSIAADTGRLTSVQDVPDTASLALGNARSVTTATVGGTTYLFVAGQGPSLFPGGVFVAGMGSSGVSVFPIRANGMLDLRNEKVHSVADNTTLNLNGAASVTTATIGSSSYLYVAGQRDHGLSVFSIATGGALTSVQDVPDAGNLLLNGAFSVTTATIGTTTYLFAGGFNDHGLSIFSIGTGGRLTSVQDLRDTGDLELASTAQVTTATIGTTTYLFTAGFNDSGVSVFSFNE